MTPDELMHLAEDLIAYGDGLRGISGYGLSIKKAGERLKAHCEGGIIDRTIRVDPCLSEEIE